MTVLPRAVESHLGSSRVARIIYGAIVGLALVAALQAHPQRARPGTIERHPRGQPGGDVD